MTKTARVTITNGVVVKTVDPLIANIEVEKTKRAMAIGASCGIFGVPEILDYNAQSGKITFKLIDGLQGLRASVTSSNIASHLMRSIGRALAIIHKDLTLTEEMILPLPDEYAMPCSEVFLHGDFGPCNICVDTKRNRLVIIDWQTSDKLGSPATYGSRYFDLTWFIYDLFYRPVGRARYSMAVPGAALAEQFLCGYKEISDFDADNCMQKYMRRFLLHKIMSRKNRWHSKRQLLLIPSHVKLWNFINSFNNRLFDQDGD